MEQFDPYYMWLGIPPKDQPPHHYRLLGLELYEPSADVIDMAADRQMTFLKQCASGPHVNQSQKLLNEIAAARLCLVRPDSKAAYDAALKKKLSTRARPDPAAARNVAKVNPTAVAPKPSDIPAIRVEPSNAASAKPSKGAGSRQSQKRLALIGGGVAVGLVLLAGLAIGLRSKDEQPAPVTKTPPKSTKTAAKSKLVQKREPVPTPKKRWHDWPEDAPAPAIAPYASAQAKRYQELWAAYLSVPVEFTNSMGMKFRLIPPGEFTMGGTPSEIDEALKISVGDGHWSEVIQSEAPQHKVVLTQPFYLAAYEVTQKEYETVMGTNPSEFAPSGLAKSLVVGMDTASFPVEGASWDDALNFCIKLSEAEGLEPSYILSTGSMISGKGAGYRLPTEAQWEFACRAGTTTQFWTGDSKEALSDGAWFQANCGGRTHTVGELQANPFRLYDILGNVWEWVQDGWDPKYYERFASTPAVDPNDPPPSAERLLRGGRWWSQAIACRSSNRYAAHQTTRGHYVSFRVALPIEAVRKQAVERRPALEPRTKTGI